MKTFMSRANKPVKYISLPKTYDETGVTLEESEHPPMLQCAGYGNTCSASHDKGISTTKSTFQVLV